MQDRHAGLLFRFLIRRVGRDAADELLGETFRIAFERRESFDPELLVEVVAALEGLGRGREVSS